MTTSLIDIYKPILIKEIIGPIIVIAVSFIIYMVIKHITKKVFSINVHVKKRKAHTLELLINNIAKYALIIIDILIILEIFGISTKGVVASLGVVSVVVGLALQDTLKDILAGISIIIENQYAIGDTITINDFKGEVISMGIKTTKIKAYTGEILIIANHNINQVINHSLAKSLALVNVQVSYEEKTEKVEEVLKNLCARLSKELKDIKGDVTLLGITDFKDSGIEYRLSVETVSMKHYEVAREIMKQIKIEFDKNKISIPYNQLVIHNA